MPIFLLFAALLLPYAFQRTKIKPPEAPTMLVGYHNDPMMGFSFKKLTRKMPWKQISKLAKKTGPLVGTVYPPAGMAIKAAGALSDAAAKGDAKAAAKVAAIHAAASAGNSTGVNLKHMLDAAAAVKKGNKAGALIMMAKAGAPSQAMASKAVISQIIKGAAKGNPKAQENAQALKSAMLVLKMLAKAQA